MAEPLRVDTSNLTGVGEAARRPGQRAEGVPAAPRTPLRAQRRPPGRRTLERSVAAATLIAVTMSAACGSESADRDGATPAENPAATEAGAAFNEPFCQAFGEFLTTYGSATRTEIATDPAAFIATFDDLIARATGAAAPLGGAFRRISLESLNATTTGFGPDDVSTVASFWNAADTECSGAGWSATVDAKTSNCLTEIHAWGTAVNAAEVSRSFDPDTHAAEFLAPTPDLRFEATTRPDGTEIVVATHPANPCGF